MLARDYLNYRRFDPVDNKIRKPMQENAPRPIQMRRPTIRISRDFLNRSVDFRHKSVGCYGAALRVPNPHQAHLFQCAGL
jgi:hypothetical protein